MQRNLINGLLLAMIAGAWLVSAPADAQTYKWTDADGKIHYSDQPPPANAKEQTTVKPRRSSAPATSASPSSSDKGATAAKPKTYVEQEAEFKKRQVETAEREAADKKKTAEAAEKKQNCEQARAQLKSLQSGGRITRTNAQGEREYLNDGEIAQEIERGKKSVDSWCN
jgi:hypothetical protein